MNETPATPATIPSTEKVTGLRIGAAICDLLLMGVLFVAMAVLFGSADSSSSSDGGRGVNIRLENGPFLLYMLLWFIYYAGLEGLTGATLGKRIFGLRVVSIDGSRPGWGAIAGRNILRLVDFLPVLYLVGLVCISVNDKKQRIGDMAAKTLVVRA